MGIVSANEIKEGDIIKQNRGDALFYVDQIKRGIEDNGNSYVDSLIVFPILPETHAPSGSQPIPLKPDLVKEKDFNRTNQVIAVGIKYVRELKISEDNYFVNRVGTSTAELNTEVGSTFSEMGGDHLRFGKEEEDIGKIASPSYENITGPVIEAVLLDGDKRMAPKEKKLKRNKQKSLANKPDIFLEDALKHGFIDQETYNILTQFENGVFSLYGALALTEKVDKAPILKYFKGRSFEEVFKDATDDITVEASLSNIISETISLNEALEKGFLRSEFTVEALTSQGIDENFDPTDLDSFDDRLILDLKEAVSLIALYPDDLENYDRPNKPNLQLTKKQINDIKTDITNAFNILNKGQALSELTQKLNNGYKKFVQEFMELEKKGDAFMMHNPNIETIKSIELDVRNQEVKLRSQRNKKFGLG